MGSGDRTYVFCCASKPELQEWLRQLKRRTKVATTQIASTQQALRTSEGDLTAPGEAVRIRPQPCPRTYTASSACRRLPPPTTSLAPVLTAG